MYYSQNEMPCHNCDAILPRQARFCPYCLVGVASASVAALASVEDKDVVGTGRYILNFVLAGLVGVGITYLLRERGWLATWISLAISILGGILYASSGG